MARFTVTFSETSTYQVTFDADNWWEIPPGNVDELWEELERDACVLDEFAGDGTWLDSDAGSIDIINIKEAE